MLVIIWLCRTGLPQCKDFFLQKAKPSGEEVSINSIYYAIFSKVHCISFLPNPLSMKVALCKLLVEALILSVTAISSDSRPRKFEMLDINNCF